MRVCGRVWRRYCRDPGRSLILLLLVQIPGLGKGKGESREGLRRLVSAKADSCGQNLVKSAGGPRSCVGLVPAVRKPTGIFCRTGHSKHCVTCYVTDTANPCSSFSFLANFIHLTFVSLWVGQNQSESFMWGSKRLEDWLLYPCSPFPGDRDSF